MSSLASLARLLKLRSTLTQRPAGAAASGLCWRRCARFQPALEEKLRARGIRVVHFISPSIWAWRSERIVQIGRAVDRMLLVFPFEQAIYDRAGIAATYVGHPLASMIPMVPDSAAARQRLASPAMVRSLPCCRGRAPTRCATSVRPFLAAIDVLRQREPDLRFVIPAADVALKSMLLTMASAFPDLARRLTLVTAFT